MSMSFTFFSVFAVFVAGVLSFLAPCVLPLVPSYLSYPAGVSLEDAHLHPTIRCRVSLHALWFVLGFAVLFALLEAETSLVSSTLSAYQKVLEPIGGVLPK